MPQGMRPSNFTMLQLLNNCKPRSLYFMPFAGI